MSVAHALCPFELLRLSLNKLSVFGLASVSMMLDDVPDLQVQLWTAWQCWQGTAHALTCSKFNLTQSRESTLL